MNAHLRALCESAGWTDTTLLTLALQWMSEQHGLYESFLAYAEGQAADEEELTNEDDVAEEEKETDGFVTYVMCSVCGTSLPIADARVRRTTEGWCCPRCL